MNIKKYFNLVTGVAFAAISITSCVQKDEWDTPPIKCENKFAATTMTMAAFKAQAPTTGYILINTDQIFDGYVVSSDENGNFYKTISFQDKPENPTVGLQIEVDRASNYADFPVGAHIRINAKGLRLGTDRGAVKLGSVDPSFDIGRIPGSLVSRYVSGVCTGNGLDIAAMKPLDLATLKIAQDEKYINMLVKVPNVQFAAGEIGKKYLNYVAGAGVDTDRNIVDQAGNATIIRNSGFASFGSTLVPEGKGDLTFVVSRYNTSWQMLIRSTKDVNFGGKRFFFEGFDGVLSDNWDAVSVTGAQIWNIQQFGNPKPCVVMNGFASVNNANEDWLISKPISLLGFTSASLSFETDVRYAGSPIEVFVTDNYSGNPTTTTWTPLSAILDPNNTAFNTWTYSGDISLNAFANKNVRIAFKYTSTTTAAATWELDNVRVVGN
ncbi:DUF5689 domain-containing protein [Chryseobacterium limigenitum]|uniref:DUF5689 domain-containing protein n=1 Tax=Chryseobacterium limigenitum TaxID=1612149 RepID=A0A1K2IFR2_9FLAO|nr:DUF5689 domain-containing protein [Chryseobacterium limigenitum]SFZ91098.1 hypothetical protein SAMN05216324_10275 [Chryseobacterium limigenitum]